MFLANGIPAYQPGMKRSCGKLQDGHGVVDKGLQADWIPSWDRDFDLSYGRKSVCKRKLEKEKMEDTFTAFDDGLETYSW